MHGSQYIYRGFVWIFRTFICHPNGFGRESTWLILVLSKRWTWINIGFMYTNMCAYVPSMCWWCAMLCAVPSLHLFVAPSHTHRNVFISVLSNTPWPKPVYVKLNEINYLIKLMKSNCAFWTNTITRNNNFKLCLSVDVHTHAHTRHICTLYTLWLWCKRSFDVGSNSGCVASIVCV